MMVVSRKKKQTNVPLKSSRKKKTVFRNNIKVSHTAPREGLSLSFDLASKDMSFLVTVTNTGEHLYMKEVYFSLQLCRFIVQDRMAPLVSYLTKAGWWNSPKGSHGNQREQVGPAQAYIIKPP